MKGAGAGHFEALRQAGRITFVQRGGETGRTAELVREGDALREWWYEQVSVIGAKRRCLAFRWRVQGEMAGFMPA